MCGVCDAKFGSIPRAARVRIFMVQPHYDHNLDLSPKNSALKYLEFSDTSSYLNSRVLPLVTSSNSRCVEILASFAPLVGDGSEHAPTMVCFALANLRFES
jgi:hypothetical protein